MNSGIWVLVIFLIICAIIIYVIRVRSKSSKTSNTTISATNNSPVPTSTASTTVATTNTTNTTNNIPTTVNSTQTGTTTTSTNLQQRNNYLEKVKAADENIFNYIRCINIPRTPTCFHDPTGTVCRSRQIDCNKFKLVLENDPIAVERMKVATDQYIDSNETRNLSDLTNPVGSGWMF